MESRENMEKDYNLPAEFLEAKKEGGLLEKFADVVKEAYERNSNPSLARNRFNDAGQFKRFDGDSLKEIDRPKAELPDFMEDYEIEYCGRSNDFSTPYIRINTGYSFLEINPTRSNEGPGPKKVKKKGLDDEEVEEMLDKLAEVLEYREHYLAEYEILMQHAVAREENRARRGD
ncbi:MAG: hypothetical protein MUP58_02865 [Candidatus Nanohaloarchaeota archaeon QJJ-9]|nr:hypothetical protein [Candidatus Nanohaloarchaeota archaeon QJJ-9]